MKRNTLVALALVIAAIIAGAVTLASRNLRESKPAAEKKTDPVAPATPVPVVARPTGEGAPENATGAPAKKPE